MTLSKKTYKDMKESKDLHSKWKDNREGRREDKERGGHRNLLREALETNDESLLGEEVECDSSSELLR